jgi:hypothetical protein
VVLVGVEGRTLMVDVQVIVRLLYGRFTRLDHPPYVASCGPARAKVIEDHKHSAAKRAVVAEERMLRSIKGRHDSRIVSVQGDMLSE